MRNMSPASGIALVSVLSLIMVVGLLAGVVGWQAGLSLSRNQRSGTQEQAYFAAYGALQRGLSELRADPDFAGAVDKPFPESAEATYTLEIVRNISGGPLPTQIGVTLPDQTLLVIAEGKVGDTVRTVAGVVKTGQMSEDSLAILAKKEVQMVGGTAVAFEAPFGSFKPENLVEVPQAAHVGAVDGKASVSTRPVELPAIPNPIPSTVNGNIASTGVDGDMGTPEPHVYTVDPESWIKGEMPLNEAPELKESPEIIYTGDWDAQYGAGSYKTLWPDHYNSWHFDGDARIELESGEYYIKENFESWQDVEISVLDGPVTIYVDGLFRLSDNSKLNINGDPRDLEIILTGNRASYDYLPWSRNFSLGEPHEPSNDSGCLSTNAAMWGKLRAPESRVVIYGDLFGRVSADVVRVVGYDDGVSKRGVVHYFNELAQGGDPNVSLEGLRFDSIWTVK